MLESQINKFLSLPEIKFIKKRNLNRHVFEIEAYKDPAFEVCPKCTTKFSKVYDHVYVNIKDTPIRDKIVYLRIKKRHFQCQNKDCRSVFREPIQGIRKGFKSTQRFQKHIQWCASNFSDLKRVMKKCKCSSWLVYKAYYEQLDLEVRELNYPWPKTIGIDEHSFVRNSKYHYKEFATIVVDYNNNRIREASINLIGKAPVCFNLGSAFTSLRILRTMTAGLEDQKTEIDDLAKRAYDLKNKYCN